MSAERVAQLEYSEFQAAMLDEEKRRRKAAKIVAVLGHFLGRDKDVLAGLTVADIGCSAGFIADELAAAGARHTFGVDIDVPGLRKASQRFGERVEFVCADGTALPFPDGSIDVLVFNHIYEHVVDPDAIMAEMRRVLSDDGVLYLGLGNRLGVMEPHYKLPFLSYLPPALADRYVRLSGRADSYYERYRTRRGLRKMVRGLRVWDYTFPVLATPRRVRRERALPRPGGTGGGRGAVEAAPPRAAGPAAGGAHLPVGGDQGRPPPGRAIPAPAARAGTPPVSSRRAVREPSPGRAGAVTPPAGGFPRVSREPAPGRAAAAGAAVTPAALPSVTPAGLR
ncbi:class I SAM-dependent methyltransferase [Streptosporangium vulgare]|uniref:class I SAM-dependent methyltransferase n=1 Tax=Streptosporangium vulgare TaxID=46190 RepID=UPI0031D1FE8F